MPDLSYQELIEPVARALLGEPNERLSKPDELRFGTHGSVAVDLAKGTFYDHEANEGGGVLDLVRIKSDSAKTRADAAKWLEHAGFVQGGKKSNGHDQNLKNTNQQKTPHPCLEPTPSHEVMAQRAAAHADRGGHLRLLRRSRGAGVSGAALRAQDIPPAPP